MKKFLLIAIAIAMACVSVATTARAQTSENVAPVASEKIVWGETSNDLQLGVDAGEKTYQRGETALFRLFVRNVGKSEFKIQYFSPLFPVPAVADEKGKMLSNILKSPPPLGFPMGASSLELAPGEQRELEQTELRIGAPITPTLFWALDAAPGQYRVRFSVQIVFGLNAKRAPLNLKSGFSALQVGGAPTV